MEDQSKRADLVKREDIINFISAHKAEFKQKYSVERIGLFGGYARGEIHADSDIDIVVELRKPDLFYLIGIKQTVEEAFDRKVDIVRFRESMNQTLKRNIERDAVYV